MNSVNERNATALAAAIRSDREKFDALQIRLEHLERQVAMYVDEISTLKQRVALLQAARGNGATQK